MSSDIEDGDDEDDEDYDDNRTEMSSAESIGSTNTSNSVSSYEGMDILTDNENSEGDIEDFMQNVVDGKDVGEKVDDMLVELQEDFQNLDESESAKRKQKIDSSKYKYKPINVKKIKVKVQKHRHHGLTSKAKLKDTNLSIVSKAPKAQSKCSSWRKSNAKDLIHIDSVPQAILVSATIITFSLVFLFPTLMTFFGSFNWSKIIDVKTTTFGSSSVNVHDPHQLPIDADISLSEFQITAINELHNELITCLQRQSPSFIKYYSSQINQNNLGDKRKKSLNQNKKKDKNPASIDESSGVSEAVACYSRENYWKNRIDALAFYHNLDLRALIKRFRNRIGDDFIAQFYRYTNPNLKLTILFNQVDYLDAVEARRSNKRLEDTVNQLRAENIELIQRLSQPRDEEYQQIMIGLEMKISKLQRENDAIKDTLSKKAGTMYMQQLIELEQLDRENDQFKQFYNHISRNVATALKSMDPKANVVLDFLPLDEQMKNLGTKLKSVEDGMNILKKNLEHLLLENDELKENVAKLRWTQKDQYENRTSLHQNFSRQNSSQSLIETSSSLNIMPQPYRGGASQLDSDKMNKSDENMQHKSLNCLEFKRWFSPSLPKTIKKQTDMLYLNPEFLTKYKVNSSIVSNDRKNKEKLVESESIIRPKHRQIGSNALQLSDPRHNLWSDLVLQSVELVADIAIRNLIGVENSSKDQSTDVDTILHEFDTLYESLIKSKLSKHNQDETRFGEKTTQYSIKSPLNAREKLFHDGPNKMGDTISLKDKLDDAWYSKRAKQRKRLRGNSGRYQYPTLHSSLGDDIDSDENSEWIFKRARTRERQRRSSQKMYDYYNNYNSIYDELRRGQPNMRLFKDSAKKRNSRVERNV